MTWKYLLPAALLTLLGCGKEQAYHAQLKLLPDFGVSYISPDSLSLLLEQQQEVLLLDTRKPEEWQVSRLPGARVVDFEQFEPAQLDSLSKSTTVVVYCSVGYRSGEIGKKLKDSGFESVFNLYGGILEWKNKGYPLVTAQGQTTEKVHTYNAYWSGFLERGEAVY